jgi:hypothetical protein
MAFKHSLTTISITLISILLLMGKPAVAAPAATRGSLRYSVIVDKFENKSSNSGDLGDEWSTLLTSKLHESGHFIVVAQDDMQLEALKEQLRGATVTVQGRKTAVRSQMIPAQLLVKGVITYVKAGASDQGGGLGVGRFRVNAGRKTTEVRATLQMIDATTGALVAAKEFVGVTQARGFSLQEPAAPTSRWDRTTISTPPSRKRLPTSFPGWSHSFPRSAGAAQWSKWTKTASSSIAAPVRA